MTTGQPRPRVAWFRDNRLLKAELDDLLEDVDGGGVRGQRDGYATATVTSVSSTSTGDDDSIQVAEVDLTLTGLTRGDLHTELTCRAWNYFHDDEEYSIVVTNSGTGNVDAHVSGSDTAVSVAAGAEYATDPNRWTLRQRQSSLTAVVHVDMNCE